MAINPRALRLTDAQREMLGLTIIATEVMNWTPSRPRSAWMVRTGGVGGIPSSFRNFSASVGQRLVDLGYLDPHPDPEMAVERGTGRTGRRFVASAAGIARYRAAAGE